MNWKSLVGIILVCASLVAVFFWETKGRSMYIEKGYLVSFSQEAPHGNGF